MQTNDPNDYLSEGHSARYLADEDAVLTESARTGEACGIFRPLCTACGQPGGEQYPLSLQAGTWGHMIGCPQDDEYRYDSGLDIYGRPMPF